MSNIEEMECGEVSSQPLNLPLIHILKTAQLAHGLRHGDYNSYHQYLTRKIRRMRKTLDFRQGNRSRVLAKPITTVQLSDSRFLALLVFEIERCWAFAMHLRDESQDAPRKIFHCRTRLAKAVKLVSCLDNLLSEDVKVTPSTRLELQAYSLWMKGIYAFEKQEWKEAKDMLEEARKIWSGLSKMVAGTYQALYAERCDEMLPQIRYCAYNIGDKSAVDDLQKLRTDDNSKFMNEQLDKLLDQARTDKAEKVTEVDWLGSKIPVTLEDVRLAVLSAEESKSALKNTADATAKIAVYESSLKSCTQAIQSLRDYLRVIEQDKNQAVAAATGAEVHKSSSGKRKHVEIGHGDNVNDANTLAAYLQYTKLVNVIGRSVSQIDASLAAAASSTATAVNAEKTIGTSSYQKPQELARLYDTIVQNLTEFANLMKTSKPDMIEAHELIEVKILAYRSFRCYYLALAHMQNKRFSESFALLKRTRLHASNAIDRVQEVLKCTKNEAHLPGAPCAKLKMELNALVSQTEREDLVCKAGRMLHVAGSNEEESVHSAGDTERSSKPLINDLDTFHTESSLGALGSTPFSLINFPPSFEPVPVKTAFFDLALNHIEYPKYSEGAEQTGDNQGGKGLTGLVKGWIWGQK